MVDALLLAQKVLLLCLLCYYIVVLCLDYYYYYCMYYAMLMLLSLHCRCRAKQIDVNWPIFTGSLASCVVVLCTAVSFFILFLIF